MKANDIQVIVYNYLHRKVRLSSISPTKPLSNSLLPNWSSMRNCPLRKIPASLPARY